MSYQGRAYGSREKADANRTGKKKVWNPNWAKKAPPVIRGSAYRPILNPSAQQHAIFANIASDSNALVVQALAGVGKTATIVESMNKYVPVGKSILYVIFANRLAREAESKCNERIDVKTCHAFALAALKKAFGKVEVDASGEKSRAIAQALLGPEDEKIELRYNFCKAMSLAKGYLCETSAQVIEVMDKHEIEPCEMLEGDFAAKVLEGMELSAKQYMRVDFDDMIYLVIKLNVSVPMYDFVFLDEAQDASPARRELVLRAVGKGGKFCAIGDRNQAIFSFTGSDSESMDNIQKLTNAHTLPLSTTYRCGKAIVKLAQAYVPEYVAAPQNPEGVVADKVETDMMRPTDEGGAAPGDFILSRVNAPLVKLCLAFVKQGRRAFVMGKDLGKNLSYMIKRSNAQSVNGFLTWLDNWQSMESERLAARNKPCDMIEDKANTLRAFCEGTNDLSTVRSRIEEMFAEEDAEQTSICLQTVHKSKGREADRVWLLQSTFRCQGPDEANVYYVAITRARTHLFMVK